MRVLTLTCCFTLLAGTAGASPQAAITRAGLQVHRDSAGQLARSMRAAKLPRSMVDKVSKLMTRGDDRVGEIAALPESEHMVELKGSTSSTGVDTTILNIATHGTPNRYAEIRTSSNRLSVQSTDKRQIRTQSIRFHDGAARYESEVDSGTLQRTVRPIASSLRRSDGTAIPEGSFLVDTKASPNRGQARALHYIVSPGAGRPARISADEHRSLVNPAQE